jgi:RNA polymerase sigma factor (sigma-70 family)
MLDSVATASAVSDQESAQQAESARLMAGASRCATADEVFTAAYTAYARRLERFACKRGDMCAADAKDLVQSAFLDLWRRELRRSEQAPLPSPEDLRHLLFRSVQNRAKNWDRDEASVERLLPEYESDFTSTTRQWMDVARTTQGKVDVSRVRRAVAKLPPKAKRLLELIYTQDLGFRDAAKAMGMSAPTVSRQLQLIHRRLRLDLVMPMLFFMLLVRARLTFLSHVI